MSWDYIKPGQRVRCVLPPALDTSSRPEARPQLGEVYTVTGTYSADYGQGCTLEGLDPFPYAGYVLYATPFNSLYIAGGWYFEPVRG